MLSQLLANDVIPYSQLFTKITRQLIVLELRRVYNNASIAHAITRRMMYPDVMIISYLIYLAIAGTNPLLVSSTGMLGLVLMYSYAFNPDYERLHIGGINDDNATA